MNLKNIVTLHLLKSFFFFIKNIFVKNNVDVVFFTPAHFNRGRNNENLFFEPLFDICNKYNISYIVFEEPEFSSTKVKRCSKFIPFDFYTILIIILRKIFLKYLSKEVDIEYFIGSILKRYFLWRFTFKNYIVLSQSLIEVFKGINKDANIFEYQHGIITKNHNAYFDSNGINNKFLKYNIQLLVYGNGFKNIFKSKVDNNFIENNVHTLGSYLNTDISKVKNNKNILFSLQLAWNNTSRNLLILEFYEDFFEKNSSFFEENKIKFYLKHHPRFENDVDLSKILSYDFVSLIDKSVDDILNNIFLHITCHSTLTFEASAKGIPTILLENKLLNPDFYIDTFEYPIRIVNISNFSSKIKEYLFNIDTYSKDRTLVSNWYTKYYSKINEKLFLKLIKEKNEKN